MPEKIGKYQVLGRIGRGGMGTIFKAHDPVLDRSVALKVISSEVEVTDELRARFFREAKACAQLSHPNIVTVYDMGEDGGRLFIVMEFLEGEELRGLVAQRKALALDDKLAVMMQVCDGLHYAHQKGIVHRDIKPGNIMVLRNGQVKILDFGIALMATAEFDLTRTGLIMGTLRYISPEQVRGRADYRSDIFSVGAVFYEFLSLRPPFNGADPIQILEQLRAEEPPPLRQLDPSIPSELAAIVDRAMQKDPERRFASLEQMRFQLEQIQQELTEEAKRVRARLLRQHDQLRELETILAERIGAQREDKTAELIDERGRLATLREREAELARQIDAARAKIGRVDALTPAFQRGTEFLRVGRFVDAAVQFEAIVAEIPDHAGALDGLSQARARGDAQRRVEYAAKLAHDAQTALDSGGYALCLEILNQAGDIPLPAEAIPGIAALRRQAEAGLAEQEVAAQRSLRQAERARSRAGESRYRAQQAGAFENVRDLWDGAEGKFTEAHVALSEKTWHRASGICNEAVALYGQVEKVAQEVLQRNRRLADEARSRALERQRATAALGAEHEAPALWSEASAKFGDAQSAVAQGEYSKAVERFDEAAVSYFQAAEEVREGRRRQRDQAEKGRQTMAESRRSAAAADAASHASSDWNEAEARARSGEAAFVREAYAEANRMFAQSTVLYRRSEQHAVESVRALQIVRANAEKASEATAFARQAAVMAQAAAYAPEHWRAGESTEARASDALSRQDYATARILFTEASGQYAAAAQMAGVTVEAETRRRERMMDEARRQFAFGDLTACLRSLNELLALEPDHAAAVALRLEADATTRLMDAATVVAASPTVLADPSTGEVMTRTAQANHGSADALETITRAPRSRLRRMALALGVATLAGVLVMMYWQTSLRAPSPHSPSSPAPSEQAVSAPASADANQISSVAPQATDVPRAQTDVPRAQEEAGPAQRKVEAVRQKPQSTEGAGASAANAGRGPELVPAPRSTPEHVAAPPKREEEAHKTLGGHESQKEAPQAASRRSEAEINPKLQPEREAATRGQEAGAVPKDVAPRDRDASDRLAPTKELSAKAGTSEERFPARRSAADEVRAVLDAYVKAYESKDVGLLQKMRPGLKPDEVGRLRDSFEQSRAYQLSLKVDSVEVSGDEAVVKGRREDNRINKGGQSFRQESSFTFRLKRTGEGWIIAN